MAKKLTALMLVLVGMRVCWVAPQTGRLNCGTVSGHYRANGRTYYWVRNDKGGVNSIHKSDAREETRHAHQ